jgi:transaldolase
VHRVSLRESALIADTLLLQKRITRPGRYGYSEKARSIPDGVIRALKDSKWGQFIEGETPLLWASTGTKDPTASDILYVKGLAAPFTVNTMPEATLNALAKHNELGHILPADGGDCEEMLAEFAKAGVDIDNLAAHLQDEGAKSFVKFWNELMTVIASKSETLKKAS